jgi:hypothetical protein
LAVRFVAPLGQRLARPEPFAQLLELIFPAFKRLRLRFALFLHLCQPGFEVFYALITVAAGLADLPTDLHASLIDALFDRAQFALHLLNVGAGIGEASAHSIDIGLKCAQIAAQTALVALQQLDLLRIDTRRQVTGANNQHVYKNRPEVHIKALIACKIKTPACSMRSPNGRVCFATSRIRWFPYIPEFLHRN